MFLGTDNHPQSFPKNWQRTHHDQAMGLFFYYLTEVKKIKSDLFIRSFYDSVSLSPQEYLYNQLGGDNLRSYFMDFVSMLRTNTNYVTKGQQDAMNAAFSLFADTSDVHEFMLNLKDTGTADWYYSPQKTSPASWSFNTVRILNSQTDLYTFRLKSDQYGSSGHSSFLRGRVLLVGVNDTLSYDLNMTGSFESSVTVNADSGHRNIYLVLASMPASFGFASETYRYQLKIDKGPVTGIYEVMEPETERRVIGRFNMLGQEVGEDSEGIQVILYSDHVTRKILRMQP
jgi:hypothetical protein